MSPARTRAAPQRAFDPLRQVDPDAKTMSAKASFFANIGRKMGSSITSVMPGIGGASAEALALAKTHSTEIVNVVSRIEQVEAFAKEQKEINKVARA